MLLSCIEDKQTYNSAGGSKCIIVDLRKENEIAHLVSWKQDLKKLRVTDEKDSTFAVSNRCSLHQLQRENFC